MGSFFIGKRNDFQKTDNNKRKGGDVVKKIKYGWVIFYGVLGSLVLIILIRQLMAKDYGHAILCAVALGLFFLPAILEKSMKAHMPAPLTVLLVLSIFGSAVLGEVEQYYLIYPYWDKVLHGVDGFVTAAIGLALLDALSGDSAFRFSSRPRCIAFCIFCISMTVGLVWEFVEFLCDLWLGSDMQKDILRQKLSTIWFTGDTGTVTKMTDIQQTVIYGSVNGAETHWNITQGFLDIGLLDTMGDLLACGAGALLFVWISYGYLKHHKAAAGVRIWIPKMQRKDP